MADYKIEWKRSALRELEKLPRPVVSRIVTAVARLATDPTPQGVIKLLGSEQTYRIRVGNYRVLYDIYQDMLSLKSSGLDTGKKLTAEEGIHDPRRSPCICA